MRHLLGVALGAVLFAVILFEVSWATIAMTTAVGIYHSTGRSYEGLGIVVVCGLYAGVLLTVRGISPLATGLPGIALLLMSLFVVISPRYGYDLVPLSLSSVRGSGFSALLETGAAALAGAIFVIPVFIPSRWRESSGAVSSVGSPSPGLGMMR